jgi:hypothetical protein
MSPKLTPIESHVKGHCPDCNAQRISDVISFHKEKWQDEDNGIWSEKTFRILKCRGCEAVYFQQIEYFSENLGSVIDTETGREKLCVIPETTYWPAPSKRTKPEWFHEIVFIDGDLNSLLNEVYTALDSDLRVLAAIGIRTTFDKCSELLDVDSDISFSQKLDSLETNKFIGANEKENLSVLTDAGNAAAHRGWKPTLVQLNTLMDIIEPFIHRSFILNVVKELKPKIPKKGSRKRK